MKNKVLGLVLLFSMAQICAQEMAEEKINNTVDSWHKAASVADFEKYFSLMTKDGVFIGTDASENWQNDEFRDYARPHFSKGRAWSFTAVERNVYINENNDFAWFDELLDTQMKLCRGSGVLKKVNGEWRIAHYVLSIAVPNENVSELIQLKEEKDSLLLLELKSKN